jgi:hypothetical protein
MTRPNWEISEFNCLVSYSICRCNSAFLERLPLILAKISIRAPLSMLLLLFV